MDKKVELKEIKKGLYKIENYEAPEPLTNEQFSELTNRLFSETKQPKKSSDKTTSSDKTP